MDRMVSVVEAESKAEEELRQKLKVAEGDAIGWDSSTAGSMSVGERMEIIGKLANPRRSTGRFYCFPPPPKQLQHRMGTTPKWGRFGVPFAEHS